MKINLDFDPTTNGLPAGFQQNLTQAAAVLGSLLTTPITVTLDVSYGQTRGQPIGSGDIASASPVDQELLIGPQLQAEEQANSNPVLAGVSGHTTFKPDTGGWIANAQAKAFGMMAPNSTEIDGYVGFMTTVPTIAQGLHEMAHALGRVWGDALFDQVDYTAPGTPNQSPALGSPGYFSTDGGQTNLTDFSQSDPSDWAAGSNDPFAFVGTGTTLTPIDLQMMQAIGFSTTSNNGTAFDLRDNTTGTTALQQAAAYSGPVSGITGDYAQITNDSINITAYSPMSFIHITGTGMDGIDDSNTAGGSILDGSSGSDFLTGSPTGVDTFYVDDRNPAQNLWSTLVNFHAGDHATVWGVSTSDFALTWIASAGAAGAAGVTCVFSANDHPACGVTFAGYSMADVSSGKLAISYGATSDQSGVPGSPYMNITVT